LEFDGCSLIQCSGIYADIWASPDGFLLLEEHAALVIALNCSLDYRLFTTNDLVALAADYQRHFTGATPRQLVRR
jgi:hypothetical protein